MNRGEVGRLGLLVSVLLMTGCSHKEPKVQKQVTVKKSVVEQHVSVAPIKLNLTSVNPVMVNPVRVEHDVPIQNIQRNENAEVLALTQLTTQEENWVPLKVEDEIEWNAKELLGRKYVWGATGPLNYDCSGFTQKIYGDVGIKLPRVSRNQAKYGQLIHFDELKKGDLVFFATNRRRPNLVTHVGIYLGNGNFIHASSGAKKVVICNFNKHRFYKKKFLWARRVIQEKSHVASNHYEQGASAI